MADQDEKAPRRRRWVGIALIASLSINLLVIGAAVGAYLKWPGSERMAVQNFGPAGFGTIARAFGDSDRKAILDDFVRHRKANGSFRDEAKADLDELVAILMADPFDPQALDDHFKAQRGEFLVRLEQGQEIIGARIKAMQEADRKAFADRVSSRYREKKRRH